LRSPSRFVFVLIEKRSALLDVAAKEGGCNKGRRAHHLGGGEANLPVVAVADSLQELFAQTVGGGYGIFHRVLQISKVLGRV
jgi:hypothetical protein